MRRSTSSVSERPLATLAILAGFAIALGVAGCDLPRDSSGTLDRVRHGTMRVGVVTNPPWASDSGAPAPGVEQQLVQELAARVNARVAWVRRPEAELLLALHRRELDLVIGGLTSSVPWQKEVAFTKPYYADTIVVGAPVGTPPITDLKGMTVAVQSGSAIAAELRGKGATPQPMDDVTRSAGLVAAPVWRLASMGRSNTGIELQQEQHVLAAPQGENAWLVQIERLLHDRKSDIPKRLRSQR
jgi:polar amino acid transport system substrate-binding protein